MVLQRKHFLSFLKEEIYIDLHKSHSTVNRSIDSIRSILSLNKKIIHKIILNINGINGTIY